MVFQNKIVFIYFSLFTFIIGLVFGSFLNCLASRYVKHVSILKGRSTCDNCNKELRFLDLIPVLSWVLFKGRCRYCGSRISIRYPLTEIFCGLVFLLVLYYFDLSLKTVIYLILFSCLFVLSLIDLEMFEIPDLCLIISIIGWIVLNIFENKWIEGIIGGIVIAGSIYCFSLMMNKILKKETMGGGDIKLLFVTGLYLGLIGNLITLLIACIIGLIIVVIRKEDVIPFGPSISIACMLVLLYGDKLINLYLGLFL